MNEPGETGQRQSGPGFANALQACLVAGVVLVDGESGVATVTPEAGRILGLAADEASELPVEALPASLASIAREALASGKPSASRQIEIRSEKQGGSVFVSAVPLHSGSTNSTVVLTLHTLNSTSQFQQQIRQLDRLANAGTLAAGMAHEIKNALVAGRTFLDLLLEKNTDSDLVQVVRRETARIDAIVSRMLRFSGSTATVLAPLHVHEVIEHALRLVQPQLNQKSILMERSFRSSPDLARGDEYELQQAFVNLLLNALEAMSQNGKLTIGTENLSEGAGEPGRLRVMIQDSGAGILPEHMNHLFEPFFTTKDYGTGLGLATTRRIIQEHGGSISVESRTGQGTTFAILLPLLVENGGRQLGGFATAMLGKRPS
jgi:nitrogen-specific signal transduction histidine kinase